MGAFFINNISNSSASPHMASMSLVNYIRLSGVNFNRNKIAPYHLLDFLYLFPC